MTDASEALVERLVRAAPALAPLLDELREADLGDALPQFFLDEAARRLTGRAAGGDAGAVADLTAVANLLEEAFGGSDELDELIASSFLVALPYRSEPGGDLVRLLGPRLSEELRRQRGWRTPPAQAALVDRLVRAAPALAPLVEENRAGDHDDVLPHMFLGDVARRAVENHLAGGADARAEVSTVLRLLEDEFGTDEGVDNAIAVSFVENLPYHDEPGADIARLLGPKLAAELRRQRPPAPPGGDANGRQGR
jgi:hypothetical protein